MAKLGREAPLAPDPVVLNSANKILSVRGSPVFHMDHSAGFIGTLITVFLKMTLKVDVN